MADSDPRMVHIEVDEDDLDGGIGVLQDNAGCDPLGARLVFAFWWVWAAIQLVRAGNFAVWKTTAIANLTINWNYKGKHQ